MASNRAGGSKVVKGKCPYCGAAVKRENLPRHLRSVHPGRQEALSLAKELEVEVKKSKPKARRTAYGGGLLASKAFIAVVVVAVIVAAGAAAYVFIRPNLASDEASLPVTQICYGSEQFAMHRHVLLHIFFNGQLVPIPAGIGLPRPQGLEASCVRPLHTHDTTGEIHIESRVVRSFSLGEFFDIWAINQPSRTIRFDATHILDKTTAQAGSIRVTVNDVDVPTYGTTALVDLSRPATSDPGHIRIYYTGP